MRTINIEFPYYHKEFDGEVIVEVESTFYKGIRNADSDWDAQDYLEITDVGVFYEGVPISIDIPHHVIYSEISSQIRSAAVSVCYTEEVGGF